MPRLVHGCLAAFRLVRATTRVPGFGKAAHGQMHEVEKFQGLTGAAV